MATMHEMASTLSEIIRLFSFVFVTLRHFGCRRKAHALFFFALLQSFVYLFDCESRSVSILALHSKRRSRNNFYLYTFTVCDWFWLPNPHMGEVSRLQVHDNNKWSRRGKRILVFVSVRAADIPRRFERVVTSDMSHHIVSNYYISVSQFDRNEEDTLTTNTLTSIRRISVAIFAFASQYCLPKWKYFDEFMQYVQDECDTLL